VSSSTLQRRRGSLPAEVQALEEPKRRAWEVLADGGRWRDAAAAAGVPIGTVWLWGKQTPAFRAMLTGRIVGQADAAADMVDRTFDEALASDADDKAKARGLRCAMHIQKQVVQVAAPSVLAHAGGVSVNINLGSVLADSLPAPPIDIDVPDV